MRVPDFTGRAAAIAGLIVAGVSFYLLDGLPPKWQSAGGKLALAGGAIVIGLLRFYRSSLREREEIPSDQLSSSAKAMRSVLLALNAVFIVVAGLSFLVCFVSADTKQKFLHLPVLVWAGCAVVCGLLREIVSAMRASREFIR